MSRRTRLSAVRRAEARQSGARPAAVPAAAEEQPEVALPPHKLYWPPAADDAAFWVPGLATAFKVRSIHRPTFVPSHWDGARSW